MKITANRFLASLFSLTLVSLTFVNCGGSSGGVTINGLGDIPSTSQMVTESSVDTAMVFAAVSGTPPKLSEVSSSNADTYFWNGMVSAINTAGSATQEQANLFWGGTDGGIAGESGCRALMDFGHSFSMSAQAGTSMCYMKGMSGVASGVTVTPSLADSSTLFEQQAADRVVRVDVSGDGEEEGGPEKVYIKVHGSNSVTSNVYRATLWFCNEAETAVTGYDDISVNKATGLLTLSSGHDDAWGAGTMTATGYLTESAGTIVFDPSQDRNFTGNFQGDWGTFKTEVTIDSSDTITTKMFGSHTFGADTWTDKGWMSVSFSGDSAKNVRFREGGVAHSSSSTGGNTFSHSFYSAIEYSDTYYKAVTSGTYYTEAGEALNSFSTDTFYTSLSSPSIDVSAYECGVTVDYVVSMDFSDSAVQAVAATCEQDRMDNMNFCESNAISTARNYVFQTFE